MDYNWLLFKIKNVNLTIKKNHLFLNKIDYNWLLFEIKNINLIIEKIYFFLGGVTNFRHINAHYRLILKTSM